MPDLASAKLFQGLPDKTVKAAVAKFTEVRHPAGHHLMSKGSAGVGFMIVLDGEVEVSGHEGHTHRLGPGEHFGEIALLDHQGRTADVTALTDVTLAVLPEWGFKNFVMSNPDISYRLLELMSQRMRDR